MSPSTRDDERLTASAQAACSVLLGYPDQTMADLLPAVRAVAEELPADTGVPLRSFLDHVDTHGLDEMARLYVATFDMKRKCCLYLTYWTRGDTRNRGTELLRFKQIYRASGAEPSEHELPDHLAVALDFAATVDHRAGNELLAEHRPGLELIRQALHAQDCIYGLVLDAVISTLPPMTDEIKRRAQERAAAGPPTELVGIGPVPIELRPFPSDPVTTLEGTRR